MTAPNTAGDEPLSTDAVPTAVGAWVERKRAGKSLSYRELAAAAGVSQQKLKAYHRVYLELDAGLQWLVDTGQVGFKATEAILSLPATDRPVLAAAIVHEATVSNAPLAPPALATVVKRRRETPERAITAIIAEVCGQPFTTSLAIVAIESPATLPTLYQAAWLRRQTLADYCAEAPLRLAQRDLEFAANARAAKANASAVKQALAQIADAAAAMQQQTGGTGSPGTESAAGLP